METSCGLSLLFFFLGLSHFLFYREVCLANFSLDWDTILSDPLIWTCALVFLEIYLLVRLFFGFKALLRWRGFGTAFDDALPIDYLYFFI